MIIKIWPILVEKSKPNQGVRMKTNVTAIVDTNKVEYYREPVRTLSEKQQTY